MENKKNINEKENFLQKTLVVALLAAICTFLWGSAFPCIKIGYRLFDIPSDYKFQIAIAIGYPDEKPEMKPRFDDRIKVIR